MAFLKGNTPVDSASDVFCFVAYRLLLYSSDIVTVRLIIHLANIFVLHIHQ